MDNNTRLNNIIESFDLRVDLTREAAQYMTDEELFAVAALAEHHHRALTLDVLDYFEKLKGPLLKVVK